MKTVHAIRVRENEAALVQNERRSLAIDFTLKARCKFRALVCIDRPDVG